MRPSVVAGKGLGFRRLGRMADYGGGDDDAIDDAILRKYFGVHDKSLRELYTSTSSDATFYKVGVLATPPIPASAGARARACQRSDPLSLSRSSAPDAKKKLAERIERKSLKSNKTVKHRIECWLRKLCQQVGASGLGSSLSLARP